MVASKARPLFPRPLKCTEGCLASDSQMPPLRAFLLYYKEARRILSPLWTDKADSLLQPAVLRHVSGGASGNGQWPVLLGAVRSLPVALAVILATWLPLDPNYFPNLLP